MMREGGEKGMLPDMPSLGQNIRRERSRLRMRQRDVAKAVGVEPPTVSMWETDRDKPGRDRLLALADLFDVPVETLAERANDVNQTQPLDAGNENVTVELQSTDVTLANVAVPLFRNLPQNVAVLGTASAGDEGDFILNGEISEYVRRPPGIASAPQVFALWIAGNSMYPRFNEGDLIYVHPGRKPRVGDDVLIELMPSADGDRPAFVKRLKKSGPTELLVEQFNPPKDIAFDPRTVAHVYRILTTAELVGT